MDASLDLITPDVLLALQLRTGNEPLLPRLRSFRCKGVTEGFIPSIPLFLSSNTTDIVIRFALNSPAVMVASTVPRLSILCPNLERIFLFDLPRDPAITEAVSEMLLACNRDTLREFSAISPLTEEARGLLYRLPKLCRLRTAMQGPVLLPPVKLPSLIELFLEYDQGYEWLQRFGGTALGGKLRYVTFHARSGSTRVTNFLEVFRSVALTTSAQNTLSRFCFRTLQSWNPNYSSLLVFKHLTELEVEFSCQVDCSSRVSDNVIISLAESMPRLKILQLGGPPCRAPTGVTFKGLVALACRCLQLTRLCIHFQAHGLANATTSTEPPPPSEHAAASPRTICALTDLEVGEAPIPQRAAFAVAITLLQIFPQLLHIKYGNPQWKNVADAIKLFRRIGGHVHHASKMHLPYTSDDP